MQAQEIPSQPHGAPLLQLNKLGKIFIRDFSVTRQPRVRPEQADPIMERPKVVSGLVRRSPATAATAKLVRRHASCDTQQRFGTPQTRGAEQFDPCGTLVGQGQHGARLARHQSPPEPSPNTPADQVGPSRARGAHSANQTLSATRGDAAERAARSRAGIQSPWHGTPVLSVLTLKRVRGTA